MKRLYKTVSLSGDRILTLDGKIVKTPGGHALTAPSEPIGQVMIQEWEAQDKNVVPATMPFTQFLSTKFDRAIPQRREIEAAIFRYLDTDLTCYRADHPPALAALQGKAWDPWLAWFEKTFGYSLETTAALTALSQNATLKEQIRAYIARLDDDVFNILQLATSISGSLVLALAFIAGEIKPTRLFEAMRVEEQYKATLYDEEQHGPDALQAEKDKSIRFDLDAAARFLLLLKG